MFLLNITMPLFCSIVNLLHVIVLFFTQYCPAVSASVTYAYSPFTHDCTSLTCHCSPFTYYWAALTCCFIKLVCCYTKLCHSYIIFHTAGILLRVTLPLLRAATYNNTEVTNRCASFTQNCDLVVYYS